MRIVEHFSTNDIFFSILTNDIMIKTVTIKQEVQANTHMKSQTVVHKIPNYQSSKIIACAWIPI